ncbi:hypothetical protein [Aliamphritea spongicola]|nr:hypothetical protein [Aliamphritea spongicola]
MPEVAAPVADQPVPVSDNVLGDGPLGLKISGVSQLTPEVRSYQLQSVNGEPLPTFSPGRICRCLCRHLRVSAWGITPCAARRATMNIR